MRGPGSGSTPRYLPGPGGHVAVRIDERTLADSTAFVNRVSANRPRLLAGEAPALALCYDSGGCRQLEGPDHDH